jgi:hypothetical protein
MLIYRANLEGFILIGGLAPIHNNTLFWEIDLEISGTLTLTFIIGKFPCI